MTQFCVLLIDDHPLVTQGLTTVLTDEYLTAHLGSVATVISANRVEQALEILDSEQAIHLIMLDLSMPALSGFDLLEALRDRNTVAPAIVLSASDDAADMQRVYELGARGFIGKLEPADAMLKKIVVVLEGGESFPEDLYRYRDTQSDRIVLTPRQQEVLHLMAQGQSNKQISTALDVSNATVKFHISDIFQLLNVHNRTLCVREANKLGLIDVDKIG